MSENTKKSFDLELDDVTAQGHYANLAIISHSATEFVLDFAAIMPGVPKAKIKSRIVLGPEHAKRLLISLQDNITRYESTVGRIDIRGGQASSSDDAGLTIGFAQGEA
ncbi:MAG: DUF3467 domain-containing protein [Alistipes sp.]|jgi:hypothetical protein|nr:DUF3467 domain-containing protein [Alistipes sp.]